MSAETFNGEVLKPNREFYIYLFQEVSEHYDIIPHVTSAIHTAHKSLQGMAALIHSQSGCGPSGYVLASFFGPVFKV